MTNRRVDYFVYRLRSFLFEDAAESQKVRSKVNVFTIQ